MSRRRLLGGALLAASLATASGGDSPAGGPAPSRSMVLRLQAVLEGGCGVELYPDGILGSETRTAFDRCRSTLGFSAGDGSPPDSAQIQELIDHAWDAKLAAILARQLGADAPLDTLRERYRQHPPTGSLPAAVRDAGLRADSLELYLQVFKRESEVWVHARTRGSRDPFVRLKDFPLTASPFSYPDSSAWRHAAPPHRRAGPKTTRGDGHVPEGCYTLLWANRWSRYHLSFLLSYPNEADLARRAHWGERASPGGSIALHGGSESAGCLAVGDAAMEEIFLLLEQNATDDGYGRIDIFPCRFGVAENEEVLKYYTRYRPELKPLWTSLLAVYEQFERTRQVPPVGWDRRTGAYRLAARR